MYQMKLMLSRIEGARLRLHALVFGPSTGGVLQGLQCMIYCYQDFLLT